MPVSVWIVALGVHPRAEPVGAQQLDRAPLEHAGADPRQHVLAALTLDHDAVDPGVVEHDRQQRTGRTGSDDRHLCASALPPASGQYDKRSVFLTILAP